jgi:hypothetical protein
MQSVAFYDGSLLLRINIPAVLLEHRILPLPIRLLQVNVRKRIIFECVRSI